MASPLPAFSTSFGFTPLAPVMPHFWENFERLQEVVTTEQNKRKQRKTRRIVRPKKKRSQVLAQTIVKRAKKKSTEKTQTRLRHSLSQRSMATHFWSPLRNQCTATPSPHNTTQTKEQEMKVSPRCQKAAHSLDQSVTKNNNFSCIRYTFATCSSITASGWIKKRHEPGLPSFRLLTATQHWLRVLIRYTIRTDAIESDESPLNRIRTFLRADAIKSDESSPNRIPNYFCLLTPLKLTKPPKSIPAWCLQLTSLT